MATYIIGEDGLFATLDVETFYKNLKDTRFNNINVGIILKLVSNSRGLNAYFNNENLKVHKSQRYVKVMNKIRSDFKSFNISSDAEKYLLFMFAVDPNFEAAKIYGQYNTVSEIRTKMYKKFGIYDRTLITIEKFFIKNFLSDKKRNEINDDITKRIYK